MFKIGKKRALLVAAKLYDTLIYEASLSEGNTMSFYETSSTISGFSPKGARVKDIIMVTGLKNGLDYILEKVEKDELYLDKQTLSMLNRIVAQHDNYDNLGGFRLHGIRIGNSTHKGTPPIKLDEDFYNTNEKYLKDNNIGVREVNLFLDLSKSQYFGDGNKRTAQLMMCGLLIKEGYAPFTVNFKDMNFAEPLIEFYENEKKRENILNKLLDIQKEVTLDFLTPKEKEEYLKEISTYEKAVPININQSKSNKITVKQTSRSNTVKVKAKKLSKDKENDHEL